eukprot:UN10958
MGCVDSCGKGHTRSKVMNCSDKQNNARWRQKFIDDYKQQSEGMETVNDENEKLTKKLDEMSQKMEEQKTENHLLKNELQTLQSIQATGGSTGDEEKLIEATALYVVRSRRSEHRVNDTLSRAETTSDIKTMVLDRYKTEGISVPDDDQSGSQEHDDDDFDTESSLESEDKQQIASIKRKTLELEERAAMTKELTGLTLMERDIIKANTTKLSLQSSLDVSLSDGYGNDEDNMPGSHSNLFHFASGK